MTDVKTWMEEREEEKNEGKHEHEELIYGRMNLLFIDVFKLDLPATSEKTT